MLRFRMYFNKDKAAAWLNRMSADGWAVRSFGAGFWAFDRCTPGEYQYAIDFAAGSPGTRADYYDFMRGIGVTPIGRWGPWVLLQRSSACGPFEMYTDDATKAAQLRKILSFFKVVCIIELLCFASLCLAAGEPGAGWWTIVFACAAGVLTLVFAVRCFELRDSIAVLDGRGPACEAVLRMRKRGLLCTAIGSAAILASFLMKVSAVPDAIKGFLMGFGVTMEVIGALVLILNRP